MAVEDLILDIKEAVFCCLRSLAKILLGLFLIHTTFAISRGRCVCSQCGIAVLMPPSFVRVGVIRFWRKKDYESFLMPVYPLRGSHAGTGALFFVREPSSISLHLMWVLWDFHKTPGSMSEVFRGVVPRLDRLSLIFQLEGLGGSEGEVILMQIGEWSEIMDISMEALMRRCKW